MNQWLGRKVFITEDGPEVVNQEIFETWEEVNKWISDQRTITAKVLTQWDYDWYRYEVRIV
jgi:hypothetical protein